MWVSICAPQQIIVLCVILRIHANKNVHSVTHLHTSVSNLMATVLSALFLAKVCLLSSDARAIVLISKSGARFRQI